MSSADLKESLAFIAGPRQWADSRESWLSRAARGAGISYRSAKAIFYGESKDPRTSTTRKIEAAAAQKKLEQEKRERRADADRLLSVAAALEAKDEEFYRDEIASYRAMAARIRNMARDRPLAVSEAE